VWPQTSKPFILQGVGQSGQGGTILNYTGSDAAIEIVGSSESTQRAYAVLRDLRLKGDSAQAGTDGIRMALATRYTLFYNVGIANFPNIGLYINGPTWVQSFYNLTISGCQVGLRVERGGATDNINILNFYSCYFGGNRSINAHLKDGRQINFWGCTMEGSEGLYSLRIEMTNSLSTVIKLDGCWVEESACNTPISIKTAGSPIHSVVIRDCSIFITSGNSNDNTKLILIDGADGDINNVIIEGCYLSNGATGNNGRIVSTTGSVQKITAKGNVLKCNDASTGTVGFFIGTGFADLRANYYKTIDTEVSGAGKIIENGIAKESAAAETPQEDWPRGTIVDFTDSDDGSGTLGVKRHGR